MIRIEHSFHAETFLLKRTSYISDITLHSGQLGPAIRVVTNSNHKGMALFIEINGLA